MKKFLAILLAAMLVFTLVACGGNTEQSTDDPTDGENPSAEAVDVDFSSVKVGFIFLHDPTDSTYDKNFQNAVDEVKEKLGLKDDQIVVRSNIPETEECKDTALELVDDGCNVIFADSFGHEPFILEAAKEHPEVSFHHATGTSASTAGVENFHNAFASIYEGRYLAGIAAGMKINEMIEKGDIKAEDAKIGYVGAFPYAEVISGYTSFFLGARSVCESATMEVKYTNSWFDEAAERTQAIALIDDGCILISQHADSPGAPRACEERKVPNVAYNVNTTDLGPTTAIISSKINWAPYMEMIIEAAATGEKVDTDWCGTIATGSVELTELNKDVAAEGTQEAIDKAIEEFKAGTLKVFDCSKFTVNGETLETYTEAYGLEGQECIATENGITFFNESSIISAPYFGLIIDGVTAVENA